MRDKIKFGGEAVLGIRVMYGLVALLVFALPAFAQVDERDIVGKVEAKIVYASEVLSEEGKPIGVDLENLLRSSPPLNFAHYRLLGSDSQPLFRSYENWLSPLGASKNLLIQFDSLGNDRESVRLNLRLWQANEVIVKSEVRLRKDKPLLIRGPRWRDGQLIVMIELLEIGD